MFEPADVTALLTAPDADPRLDERYVRLLPGTETRGPVCLLGVVHDHPASVYRVARLVGALEPEVLALELPPLSVPLFVRYADQAHDAGPPVLGGEMSAAIHAAGGARVVGVDAPNRAYLRRHLADVLADPPGLRVGLELLRDALAGSAQTVATALGALVATVTPIRPQLYDRIEYGVSAAATPAEQAADEVAHLRRRRAFVDVVETPEHVSRVDAAREAAMAARIAGLARQGAVVAVVGVAHLDGLATILSPGQGDGV